MWAPKGDVSMEVSASDKDGNHPMKWDIASNRISV